MQKDWAITLNAHLLNIWNKRKYFILPYFFGSIFEELFVFFNRFCLQNDCKSCKVFIIRELRLKCPRNSSVSWKLPLNIIALFGAIINELIQCNKTSSVFWFKRKVFWLKKGYLALKFHGKIEKQKPTVRN